MRVARTTDNSTRESRWTSRAFRDDERIAIPRLQHYARTWHELRVRRLLYRSETPVLKFVVSGPVRSDVSPLACRVNASERAATLTLCTRSHLRYIRIVTHPTLKNGSILCYASCTTQYLCEIGWREIIKVINYSDCLSNLHAHMAHRWHFCIHFSYIIFLFKFWYSLYTWCLQTLYINDIKDL